MPPVPPAGRSTQGNKSTTGRKTNPKDAQANDRSGNGKQVGVSKSTQSNRNSGNR
jgi:hypothetical protein